jgi:hypothetical protein
MGREASFGKTVRARVTGVWHRIENSAELGTPDMLGCVGGHTLLVELKSLLEWQGDLALSGRQRLWQRQWSEAGGRAYTLAKVERTIYLVRGDRLLRSGTRQQWRRCCSYYCADARVNWEAVRQCFIQGT